MTISREEMQRRKQDLLNAGFDDVFIDKSLEVKKNLYVRSATDTINYLVALGFTNPTKLITSHPSILSYSFENIDAKIAVLKERGFTNPTKLITTLPSILGYSFENIDAKIAGLKERGFTNPTKLITTLPSILSLGFENIDAKIAGLKERGFTNPTKLITSHPSILGYSFENSDWRLRYLRRLLNRFALLLSAQKLMETYTFLWSSKKEKLQIIVHFAQKMKCDDVNELCNGLSCNLESFLLAYVFMAEDERDFRSVRMSARKAGKTYGTLEEKRQKILVLRDQLPPAVYRLYSQAYIK